MVALLAAACGGLVAGCAPGSSGNNQQVIDNAMDADAATVEDADDRADRLDERAAQLIGYANATSDATAARLRNEAAEDLREAAVVRRQGTNDGAAAEESIERGAGLLNGQ